MLFRNLLLSCLLAASSSAQNTETESGTQSLVTITGSYTQPSFTGTYATDTEQSTVSQTSGIVGQSRSSSSSQTSSGSSTGTITGSTSSMTTISRGSTSEITLLLGGGVGLETLSVINGTTTIYPNTTASATRLSTSTTASSAAPTNTQPCNGYPQFCNRKYSNITEVCAHNSAFVVKGNAASNQALPVTDQLNDGIRMIQGETHLVNNTIYNCHTSCDLLNAGTWQSEMETVAEWVRDHPYDVVTILIVNSDYVDVGNYTAPLQASGLGPYLYEPPKVPMHLDDWPTLSEMILSQKRVVVFMDYNANQTAVPYILDEFTHMWETPFSPQNTSFPCTVDRPPTLKNMTVARDQYMYLANHNLNQEISFFGTSILLPNTASINTTNAASNQLSMLGAMANNCTGEYLDDVGIESTNADMLNRAVDPCTKLLARRLLQRGQRIRLRGCGTA